MGRFSLGRHKIPEIIEFIKSLKDKGESLGFIVEDECKVLDGLYWIDLVWSYRKDHSLFITFEIENKETERLLKNIEKIFKPPSSEVEKPYHHFIIIFNGTLSAGMKKIVNEETRRLNVHVFEDLKNDSSEYQRLNKKLKQLQIQLPELVKRRAKADSVNVVHDVIKGLEGVVPILKIQGQSYQISQSTLTSSSTIPQKSFSSRVKGIFDTNKHSGFALIPIPRKKFVLLIPNTAFCVDVFLKNKTEGVKTIHLSFEGCELPFTLDLDFIKKGGGGFHISLNSDVADVVHVKKFEDLVRAYDKYKVLQIMDVNGKVIAGCEGASLAKPVSSDGWYNAISDLAYIQTATSHRISCPKDLKISPKANMTISRTKRIIDVGDEVISIKTLTFTLFKEQLEKLIEIQTKQKKISDLTTHIEQYCIDVLDEKLSLGPVTWKFPDMRFKEPLDELMTQISAIAPKTLVKVAMIPLSDTNVQIIYHNWKK